MSRLLATILLLLSLTGYSQLTVSPGTVMNTNALVSTDGNVINGSQNLQFGPSSELVLNGTADQGITTNENLLLPRLTIDGGGNKAIFGSVLVGTQLNLVNGLLFLTGPVSDNNLTILNGGEVITEGNSWVVGPLLQQGAGAKLYPVGTANRYAPILLSISGNENTVTGSAAISSNGNFVLNELPNNVEAASANWLWPVFGTNINSVGVTVPLLPEDEALVTSDDLIYTILEADTVRNVSANLGGFTGTLSDGLVSVSSSTETLNDNPAGEFARVYLLGSVRVIIPIIHNIITPNADNSNDYLIVDGIDAYGDDNEVILLDRWGVEVYRKKNFRNFNTIDNPYDGSFDFLAAGNYICLIQYAGNTAKQVITVLN